MFCHGSYCFTKIGNKILKDSLKYLVAPDTGFFGNKVVESILHFWVCWDQQQQLPHTKGDPEGNKNNYVL